MHPVLLSLDLGGWRLPLLPWLSLITVGLATAALIGWRLRRLEITLAAGVAATVSAVAAVTLRGHAFAPHSLVVTSYGALLAASLVGGWWWTSRLAAHAGLDRAFVSRAFFAVVFAGIVGARVGYVLMTSYPEYHLATALDLRGGGLSGYTGLVSGLAALVLVLRGTDASWLRVADAASPSLALGLVMVRVGGYLSGSAFGLPLAPNSPGWLRALGTFPRWSEHVLRGAGSPAWVSHVERGIIDAHASASAPVHPTQLYLAAAALVLMVVAVRRWQLRRFPGEVFLTVAFGYGVIRFVIDCWRDDPQRLLLGPSLPAAAFVGVGLLALGVAFQLGPAHAVERVRWRQGTWALALGLALVGALAARSLKVVEPSLSQWVGLGSALAAASFWRPCQRSARP